MFRTLATIAIAACGSLVFSQGVDEKKVALLLTDTRQKLPSIACEIKEESEYSPESKDFYGRDYSDRNAKSTYRWGYSEGRLGRTGTIVSSNSEIKPVSTREFFDGKTTKFLGMSSHPGKGREGQGLMMGRKGLDSQINLLLFGFKVGREWIDDLVREGRFVVADSSWKYQGRSPTIELSGLNDDNRPTKVWLSTKHDLLAVRCITTQSDGTELYFEPTELVKVEGRWFPSKGEWGVKGQKDGKSIGLMNGTVEASDLKVEDPNSELFAKVEFPERSTVADADTGKFYRVENGNLVEFDPRASTRAASMLPGWLFMGGSLVFLGLVTRVFLSVQANKSK